MAMMVSIIIPAHNRGRYLAGTLAAGENLCDH